jgi:GNAT superfamily N-acetyltransferase
VITIQTFTTNDYQALVDIENSVFTDEFFTAESVIEDDAHTPAHIKHGRLLARLEGRAIGYAEYGQRSGMYHPQRFYVGAVVRPEFQQRGVATALWTALIDTLEPFNPIGLTASSREDKFGADFLKKRGFVETMRTWENRLRLESFDFAPYQQLETQLEANGIRIYSARALEAMHSDYLERWYDMWCEARLDVPRSQPTTPVPFDEWLETSIKTKFYEPEANFIAVRGEDYIGLSQLFKTDAAHMNIGLTGVRRADRGQQIALALKIKCLEWAAQNSIPEIRTWNDSNNVPILKLNERLGFVKCPAWVEFNLELPS